MKKYTTLLTSLPLSVALSLILTACSTDSEEPEKPFAREPLHIQNISCEEWAPTTRAVLPYDQPVYVAADGASAQPFTLQNGHYEVASGGVAPEWKALTMSIYGFFRSDGATAITQQFSVPTAQNGGTVYNFQASPYTIYDYTSSGSISLALTQQLCMIQVTVSDAVSSTRVYLGNTTNNRLACTALYNPGTASADGTAGTWNTSIATPQTITLSPDANGKFTAYVIPQTVSNGSHFFRVSNSDTHNTYYSLPINTLVAGKVYTCTLVQDMEVANIQIDEDFGNNNGYAEEVVTVAGAS